MRGLTGRLAAAVPAGMLAGMLSCGPALAEDFVAMPGLWKTTYEVDGAAAGPGEPNVFWHCVDEEADPWVAFAQLQDLPGMACTRNSLERTGTSLKWKTRCRGPGPDSVADVIEAAAEIVFDSPQHYTGWVRFDGTLMGYPLRTRSKVDGARKAACTSASD